MPKISAVRTILLSSPYADPDDPEIKECFPNGAKRTIGMVELTFDNGIKGIGEGYLAVFAPLVFKSIVDLCTPYVIGLDGYDAAKLVRRLRSVCDYWSLQGAARHVISAFEIALQDAKGKSLGVPVYDLLGGAKAERIPIYGSGGCCDAKEQFLRELDQLDSKGIKLYKIRSVKRDLHRTAWALNEAAKRGIKVGVDMCQNLADPPQPVEDVIDFVNGVYALTKEKMIFLEEAIGPDSPEGFRELRSKIDVPVYGGEIITTPKDMISRMEMGCYAAVQPDASVIGGISAVMEIFSVAPKLKTDVIVHAWSGAAAIMASYHAAFAAGGKLVEFPMLYFPVNEDMIGDQVKIVDGELIKPTAPGLGLNLTREIEALYPFDEMAVYSCVLNDWGPPPDSYWK